ncbi:LysR family transcriptional regulator [Streptomyces sp. P17]|uniref:LysR family transcriptional regulator n=1 Tax=Streptomyces sp. P17 TaxID=3074716 RepID=UPI0028F44498|nr:LysR family transcriptional regulator [Streptomyces sp. P17]MDT9699367.1 LysR family transcriptional regulator [Streptomyces sp. P17]
MELRLLVTFEKVATVLSFTRAAAEPAYAQSSVTSQIRALESSLGTELFDRLGGRIRLTQAGERLLPYARQIIELAEEARAAVTAAEEPTGSLVVGTMESLTSYRLPPLLELFHHRCRRPRRSRSGASCPPPFLRVSTVTPEGARTFTSTARVVPPRAAVHRSDGWRRR